MISPFPIPWIVEVPLSLQFDLQSSPYSALAQRLADCESMSTDGIDLTIRGCDKHDGVGAGLRFPGTIALHGSIGDFCFLSFGNGDGTIEGSVGDFFGHSIQSGSLIARGHAGAALGAMGVGGLITVYGNAGDRVGTMLQSADIVVRGSTGSLVGLGMIGGNIVIGGNTGTDMGKGMTGGAIFLRGEAASVSPHVEEVRMREPDKLKIGLLMLKSGIKTTGKEFKLYRPIL